MGEAFHFHLEEGTAATVEKVVAESDLAISHGSGNVKVFATPALVALMEQAALKAASTGLPESLTTVGIEVSVKHLKATPPGMKVTATAKLTAVEGRLLKFHLEAFDEVEKIGEGHHERFVVNAQQFEERSGAKHV